MIWLLGLNSLRLRPLRSTLTVLGIAVAVASTVIFLSLGEGLRRIWRNEIGSVGPELQVSYGPFDTTSLTALPELPLSYLQEIEAEADAYAITKAIPLLFYFRGGLNPGQSFLFQGIPLDTDLSEIYIDFRIVAGRTFTADEGSSNVAIIGSRAAERNRLEVGDNLRLNPQTSYTVAGIASSAGGLVDNAIIVPLETLQRAIGISDRVSFFALDLREPGSANEVAQRLRTDFPELGFQTRADVLGVIEQGIRISDVVRLGISAIALIVGAIAVANTMLMSVFERTREFGVVRAIGAAPFFLFGLVLFESILLSTVGAGAGVALGRLGIAIVNALSLDSIGLEVASLTLRLVLFAVIVALFVGIFSGLLPATRAARISIARSLAHE
ncbi:MAG: ABC transporter permease [Trueperaceae bacterium]|nr:MAG: ABC transporter permease [Trueperaceae bacterium]